jgi:hypothetical protein
MTGLLVRHKFLALLIVLALLLVAYPFLAGVAGGLLLFNALRSAAFLATLPVVLAERRFRLPAVLLGVPTLAGNWARYFLTGLPWLPLAVGFQLVAALFLAVTVAAILRSSFRQAGLSVNAVFGALCGYLLVGVAFSHLYAAVELVSPGSLEEKGGTVARLHDENRQEFTLVYFSLVTLTTVGYGDVTPASDPARGLVATEAVLGNFYVAVLIAGFVGMRVSLSGPRT